MASSQTYWEEQLDSRLEQLEKDVRSLRTLPFREQQTVINSSKLAVKAVKGLKKNFDMATRSISDDAKKAAGKEKVRESEKRLRVVEDELKRAELFLTDDRLRVEEKSSDGEYLESIRVVQDKTKESLERQVKKINETVQVADRTAEQLENQGDKINKMNQDMLELGEKIDGAHHFIRRFKRQVSRDRICQTLVALNIILLITLGCVVGFRWQTLRHAIGI